jgi:nitroreductase
VDIFEAIHGRRTTRSFRPDPAPRGLIERVIDAARVAPSGNNRQPWEFVAITDKTIIHDLAMTWSGAARRFFASLSEEQIDQHFAHQPSDFKGSRWASGSLTGESYRLAYGAPVLIVVLVRHPEIHENYPSAFLATQNLLLAAHALGLAAVITTRSVAHLEDAEAIRRRLGAPEDYLPVAVVPLGYAAKAPGPIRRRALNEVLHWNQFGQRSAPAAADARGEAP